MQHSQIGRLVDYGSRCESADLPCATNASKLYCGCSNNDVN